MEPARRQVLRAAAPVRGPGASVSLVTPAWIRCPSTPVTDSLPGHGHGHLLAPSARPVVRHEFSRALGVGRNETLDRERSKRIPGRRTPRLRARSRPKRSVAAAEPTWWAAPLCEMARRKSPSARGIPSRVPTLIAPAESPKIVTFPGSPLSMPGTKPATRRTLKGAPHRPATTAVAQCADAPRLSPSPRNRSDGQLGTVPQGTGRRTGLGMSRGKTGAARPYTGRDLKSVAAGQVPAERADAAMRQGHRQTA